MRVCRLIILRTPIWSNVGACSVGGASTSARGVGRLTLLLKPWLGDVSDVVWAAVPAKLAGWNSAAFSAAAVQSAEVFGAYSLFETLAGAPVMVAGGVLAYSMVCALAMRVLYKNLNPNRPDGRYAHVSAS